MGALLDEKYVRDQIEADHLFLLDEMQQISLEMTKSPTGKDFPIWQFELIWRLRDLKNRLLRHFELEEQNSFKGDILLRSPDNLKKIQELKYEHGEITIELAHIVSEIKKAEDNERSRIDVASQRLEDLFTLIRVHEAIESELIGNTIKEFKLSGRFQKEPTFDEQEIAAWEKKLGIPLPDSYKTVLCSGSYDTATFNFTEPRRCNHNPDMIIFASWNDINFAFDTSQNHHGEYPICVECNTMGTERRYDDFPSWFNLVFQMANQPVESD